MKVIAICPKCGGDRGNVLLPEGEWIALCRATRPEPTWEDASAAFERLTGGQMRRPEGGSE